MDALGAALKIAGSGLEAQSTRLRIVSENLANAQATGNAAGAAPYQRKTISFSSELDRVSGANLLHVSSIGRDSSAFNMEYDPGNPAADAEGNVKHPNVNVLVELADMREANRAYEADLQVMKQSRDLLSMTIDLLKGNP